MAENAFEPGTTEYFVVLTNDGALHCLSRDHTFAWTEAHRIHGWIGATTFAEPIDLAQKLGEETAKSIEDFLSGKTPGVRRGWRPGHTPDVLIIPLDKSDIDEDPFDFDQPS